MRAPSVDLTPFGFTPTESHVYAALLNMGMASGYAVGKQLNLARANVYQALNGLVAKGAADRSGASPQRFEAATPTTLLAKLARSQSDQLDRLERQLHGGGEAGGTGLVPIQGRRSLLDLALRTAARTRGAVAALADGETLHAMAPIWRKRLADQADTRVWVSGGGLPSLPLPAVGVVEPERVEAVFRSASIAIVVTPEAAILARDPLGECSGHWTSHPLLVSAAHGALLHLTAA